MYGNGIALVTGAASGLGRATAVALANKGYKVMFADMAFVQREASSELQSLIKNQENACYCEMNVIDEESVNNGFQRVKEEFGQPPSLVVHCAGITASKPLIDDQLNVHPLSLFNNLVTINCNGTFNVSRLAARNMLDIPAEEQEERGLIVATASMAGYEGDGHQIAYAASKAGVIGMTLPFARALGPYGIRFNSIAPGLFYTPMLKGYEEIVESLMDFIPFPKRLGITDDYVKTVEYLMDCSYVNGCVLRVDGGVRL